MAGARTRNYTSKFNLLVPFLYYFRPFVILRHPTSGGRGFEKSFFSSVFFFLHFLPPPPRPIDFYPHPVFIARVVLPFHHHNIMIGSNDLLYTHFTRGSANNFSPFISPCINKRIVSNDFYYFLRFCFY